MPPRPVARVLLVVAELVLPEGARPCRLWGGTRGPPVSRPPSLWLTMSVATAVLPSLSQACQTSVLSVRLAPGGMTGNCP